MMPGGLGTVWRSRGTANGAGRGQPLFPGGVIAHGASRGQCHHDGVPVEGPGALSYTVRVGGQTNPDAAWYYPKPSRLARKITDHVAFGNGVQVEGETEGEASGLLDRLRGRR